MKVHEANGGLQRKYDEKDEDYEALEKYYIEKTNEYKKKISCRASFTEEMKDVLDIYYVVVDVRRYLTGGIVEPATSYL